MRGEGVDWTRYITLGLCGGVDWTRYITLGLCGGVDWTRYITLGLCGGVDWTRYITLGFVGALTGPNTSPSSLFKERELLTFSVLVIFSLGNEMSFLCSALIRWSFKTIALNECTFSKFVVDTFSFSSPSYSPSCNVFFE